MAFPAASTKTQGMGTWIRFDKELPSQGQYLVAITQRDAELLVEDWEMDLEKNAVGIWIDGEVWEGNTPKRGFTHWMPISDRPLPEESVLQLSLWDALNIGPADHSHRR